MDPDAALAQMRLLSTAIVEVTEGFAGGLSGGQLQTLATEAIELAEAVQAMDVWMSKGGHKPLAWHVTEMHG